MSSFSLKPEGAVSRLEKIYAVKQKACKILNSQLAPAEEARRLFQVNSFFLKNKKKNLTFMKKKIICLSEKLSSI